MSRCSLSACPSHDTSGDKLYRELFWGCWHFDLQMCKLFLLSSGADGVTFIAKNIQVGKDIPGWSVIVVGVKAKVVP